MLSFKQLTQPHFGEIFEQMDQVCSNLHIPFYLIGSNALHVYFIENRIRPPRKTNDIDFAVMIPSVESFEQFREMLFQSGFRNLSQQEPYRIVHIPTTTIVDILPFGPIANEEMVSFADKRVELSVVGMETALRSADTKRIGHMAIRVPTLAGIVLLKMIAYRERPQEREKDLDDIKAIIQQYFNIYHERFYDELYGAIEEIAESEYDFMVGAGARLLGNDLRSILETDIGLLGKVKSWIAEEQTEELGPMTRYYLTAGQSWMRELSELPSSERAFTDPLQLFWLFTMVYLGLSE